VNTSAGDPRTAASTRAEPEPSRGNDPGDEAAATAPVPRWLRAGAAVGWRFLVVVAAIAVVLFLLAFVRVVVLPIIVAVLITTLLLPPFRWLQERGLPPAAAATTVMVAGFLLLAGVLAAVTPAIVGQVDELGRGVQDGLGEAGDLLAQPPFNLSEAEIRSGIDEGIEALREDSGPLTQGVQTGAILIGEIITGLIIAVLLTFFFLKDGVRMWAWLVDLAAPAHRTAWNEIGARVLTALGGYVRGIALVGVVNAVLVGVALLVIGVPLIVPLMLLTFIGAFLPLIGAFLAGLAAVLIALVSGGLVDAALILGAIVIVQQIEGHLLYPVLMGRAVQLHPAVIIVALGVGGIVAGIIGIFLAVPVAGAMAVVLAYVRDQPAPRSPVADTARAPAA